MNSVDPRWLSKYAEIYSQSEGMPNFGCRTLRRREFLDDAEREITRLQDSVTVLEQLAIGLPSKLETVTTPRYSLIGFLFGRKTVLRPQYQHVLDDLSKARDELVTLCRARDHFIALSSGSERSNTLSSSVTPDRLTMEAESAFWEARENESYLFRVKDGRNFGCERCNRSLVCDVGVKVYKCVYCYTCAKELFRVGGLHKRNFGELAGCNPHPVWLVFREDDTTPATRQQVLERDRYKCRDCGKQRPSSDLEVHHVLPRNFGGDDRITNLVTLCKYCHDREFWFRHFRKDPSTLGEKFRDYNRRTSVIDGKQTSLGP